MREIKFRVWLLEHKEMWHRVTFDSSWDYTIVDGDWEIDNSIVKLMQYTGLKDKNGVEIYEGDIVKLIHRNFEFKSSVVYKDYMYLFVGEKDHAGSQFEYGLSNGFITEVIGNIYENPELLKED